MRKMHKHVISAIALGLALYANSVQAGQFTIRNDVVDGQHALSASYIGAGGSPGVDVTDNRGIVEDGGYDAFDGMGLLNNVGGLTTTRRTEAFQSLNIYRWFDTFTNQTSSDVTQTVAWWGNLGSDGHQTTYRAAGSSFINVDGNNWDPVIAFVYGNNTFASNSMNSAWYCGALNNWGCSDNVTISSTLTLAPGESASLLTFAFLARDAGDRSGDEALAASMASQLVANPYLDGLSQEERARILNFGDMSVDVPEPGTAALLAFGLLGFSLARRRKS